jgi:hypothetical protein
MKKPILLLALSSILFSTVTVAEYKINITSPVLNKNSKLVEFAAPTPDLVPFDETGDFGNIALIGSNGITESSITSNAVPTSSNHGFYRFSAIFDGYQGGIPINSSTSGKLGSGYFYSISGNDKNRYFSVDLGKEASISGFRVLSYGTHNKVHYPKDVRIDSSVDGVSFTAEESFTLPLVIDSGVVLMDKSFTSRYFRFHVENAYNSGHIRIGELEVFQTQP